MCIVPARSAARGSGPDRDICSQWSDRAAGSIAMHDDAAGLCRVFDCVYFLTRCTHTSIKLKLLYLTHLKVEKRKKRTTWVPIWVTSTQGTFHAGASPRIFFRHCKFHFHWKCIANSVETETQIIKTARDWPQKTVRYLHQEQMTSHIGLHFLSGTVQPESIQGLGYNASLGGLTCALAHWRVLFEPPPPRFSVISRNWIGWEHSTDIFVHFQFNNG